jgi:predicted molibdopterin-dependent oxidoreductase YjgC
VAGSNLNTEEYLALRKLALEVLDTQYFHFGEELLGGVAPDPALLGALTAHTGSIADIVNASTVLTIGADLFDEAPALGIWLDVHARRGRTRLFNLRSHGSGADSGASYVPYPAGDLLRWVRALTNAVNGSGESLPELAAVAAQLRECGDDCAILFGSEVWQGPQAAELVHACAALHAAVAAANAGKPAWLNPVYPGANTAGALLVNQLAQFASHNLPSGKQPAGSLASVLKAAADGKLKALLIVEADLLNTYPDRRLAEAALAKAAVVYCGPFGVPTADHADVVLPLGTWAHREGTVVNLEWRVQKRMPGQVDSVAPSVLDLCNILASSLGHSFICAELAELYLQLGEQASGWPLASFASFPGAGQRFAPQLRSAAAGAKDGAALPAAGTPAAGDLRLIAKRFLYNDRPEIVHSPVFGQVWKPFCAFLNPADATRLKLVAGDWVELGGAQLRLPVKLAGWVEPGSVVINDLCHAAPANALHGTLAVSLKKSAPVAQAVVAAAGGGQ